MNRIHLIGPLVLLAGLSSGAAPVRADPTTSAADSMFIDFASLDDFLSEEMAAQQIPGLAVGVVEGQQIVHVRGFGAADAGGRAVNPDTPFVLASTSKELTALAAMQLVELRKLDLDAAVRSYLPWFATADRELSDRITVRQLLNQTSGLSTLTGRLEHTSDDREPGALERAVRRLDTQPLLSQQGDTFHYSNANYMVLGLLVQTVSDQRFDAYMREHVFVPLDMRHTFTDPTDAQSDGLATGYYQWFNVMPLSTQVPFSDARVPAEAIMSSAEDLAHVVVMHLNGGRYAENQLVSSAGLNSLHTGVARVPWGPGLYAMGWFAGPLAADLDADQATNQFTVPLVLDHTGEAPNYHSVIALLPGLQRGAVLVMNTDRPTSSRFARLQVGIEQLLAGSSLWAPHRFTDDPLTRFGRTAYVTALIGELVWILVWGWNARRRRHESGPRRRRTSQIATVLGFVLLVGGVYFLWFVIPSMNDITPDALFRVWAPDLGLTGLVLTE